MTDTTQPITANTANAARWCAVGAGVLGAFLTGVLVATAAGDYGVGLTRTSWDLVRAGVIFCGIFAVLAGMTWWGVEQVSARLDRNRNAALELMHRLDGALAELPALRRELCRVRGGVDGRMSEAVELMDRIERRMAADIMGVYDLGAQSKG